MHNVNHKRFYDELASLTEVATSYESWVTTVDSVSDEALEITRQMEACKVCFLNEHPVY